MRDIIFRGKCKYDGKWIEGYLVKLGRESFSDHERYGICNKAVPLGGSGVCYNLKIDEVIPETVGQYTGLTDKNGTKIFEGDILKVKSYWKCDGNLGQKATTYWTVEHKNFSTEMGFFTYGIDRRWHKPLTSSRLWNADAEVFGNIYDNPELLKGEGE